jgi:hypothetical protein
MTQCRHVWKSIVHWMPQESVIKEENMKNTFKRVMIVGMAACLLFNISTLTASDRMRPPEQRGDESSQILTDEQKAQVQSILSSYNASTLTTTDANAIFEAFRKAGLRGGPSLLEAIRNAGFDPEKIRALATAPKRPPEGRMPPDRP